MVDQVRCFPIILQMDKNNGKQFSQQVNIKSKYLNSQQCRNIIVSPEKEQISISQSGTPQQFKQFHIDQLNSTQTQGNTVFLEFDNGRTYEVQSEKPENLHEALMHTRNLKLSNKFVEQSIPQIGMSINYCQAMTPLLNLINKPNLTTPKNSTLQSDQKQSCPPTTIQKSRSKMSKPKREYKTRGYYIDPANWRVTKDQGHMIILNEEWKNNATKIVGFLVKKFLSTGSFMGLSFPVFAMKPESILETYAKSVGGAPKIFTKALDSVQRMKEFISFIWSLSSSHVTLLKPFNPVIGETFQADIAGGTFAAQQICHHPPISAFIYQKDNYRIEAALEMTASIGLNSGQGRFIGDITIKYDDGHWIKGRLTNGQMVGIMVGEMKFCAFGGSYAYDSQGLVLTYQHDDNKDHNFEGYIGILKHKAARQFEKTLKDQNRFVRFKAYPREDYSKIFSKFVAKYSSWVAFDGKQFFNLKDERTLPYQVDLPQEPMLKSDSRYRQDLELLKRNQIEASQQQKQRIENIERDNRKLREKYGPKKK